MAVVRKSQVTNARVIPQERAEGTGKGRTLFKWKDNLPWLVVAADQIAIEAAGSADALLENRYWAREWGITPARIKQDLEVIFPGITDYLWTQKDWNTPWEELLKNRVYKMYYNGTSARGYDHDPNTRASISNEHWRSWKLQDDKVELVLEAVAKHEPIPDWKERLL